MINKINFTLMGLIYNPIVLKVGYLYSVLITKDMEVLNDWFLGTMMKVRA